MFKVGDVVTILAPWSEGQIGIIRGVNEEDSHSFFVQNTTTDETIEYFDDELESTQDHQFSDYFRSI